MRILITQSNYLPWRGYYAAMRAVDYVVFLDSAQFTKRDWRNRNRIRYPDGAVRWLTVPVATRGRFSQAITEVSVTDTSWIERHRGMLAAAYRESPGWDDLVGLIAEIGVVAKRATRLSDINVAALATTAEALGIATPSAVDRDGDRTGSATEKLVAIARAHHASVYVSAPRARDYMDVALFLNAGVQVEFLDYAALPADPDGVHNEGELSILDVIARRGLAGARALSTFSETIPPDNGLVV